jgi:hypothetical protein
VNQEPASPTLCHVKAELESCTQLRCPNRTPCEGRVVVAAVKSYIRSTKPLRPHRPDDIATAPRLVRQGRQGGVVCGTKGLQPPPPLPQWPWRPRLLVAVGHSVSRGESGQRGGSGTTLRVAPRSPSPTSHRPKSAWSPASRRPGSMTRHSPLWRQKRSGSSASTRWRPDRTAPSPPFHHRKGYSNDDDDTDGDGGAAGQGGHMYAQESHCTIRYNGILFFSKKIISQCMQKIINRSSDHWLFSVWLCI